MRSVPMVRLALTVGVAAVTLAPTRAQQTWIVDAQSRPGTQFTALQPAFDAASAGDVVIVRDGSYHGATLDKGLSVLAEPGAVIDQWFVLLAEPRGLVVQDVPAGEVASVRGLAFGNIVGQTSLYLAVANCAGVVHLEELDVSGGSTSLNEQGIVISDCAHASLVRCRVVGRSGVWIRRSSVALVDCTVSGYPEHPVLPFVPWVGPASGIDAREGSRVWASHCDLRGGSGFRSPGGSGVMLVASELWLTGDENSLVSGAGSSYQSGWAIGGDGTATYDPIVPLVFNIQPTVTATATDVPALRVGAAVRGQSWDGDLRGPAGRPYAVALALPGAPLGTPWGLLWLNPTLLLIANSGVLDAGGTATWSLPVPDAQGVSVTWQAAVGTTGGLRLSNPTTSVVE
ncbi:MAG: hypothetical protein AAF628_26160 [Planctomycetota bacterium]